MLFGGKSYAFVAFLVALIGHGGDLVLQTLLELGVAVGDVDVVDGIPEGALLTDNNADFLGSGDGGVDEVALEHDVDGEVDGDDDYRILAALALVDCGGVGKVQLVEFGARISHFLAVEVDGEDSVFHVYVGDKADVAIEHFLGVVVL